MRQRISTYKRYKGRYRDFLARVTAMKPGDVLHFPLPESMLRSLIQTLYIEFPRNNCLLKRYWCGELWILRLPDEKMNEEKLIAGCRCTEECGNSPSGTCMYWLAKTRGPITLREGCTCVPAGAKTYHDAEKICLRCEGKGVYIIPRKVEDETE